MATDWWPEQESRICDGLTLTCNAEGTITEGDVVKHGTSTASQIRVTPGTGLGDGWGVALKTTTTAGEPVPVIVFGLQKMTSTNGAVVTTQGYFVMNSNKGAVCSTAGVSTYSGTQLQAMKTTAGSYLLGMAMQTTTATGDEFIVFVGKGV